MMNIQKLPMYRELECKSTVSQNSVFAECLSFFLISVKSWHSVKSDLELDSD